MADIPVVQRERAVLDLLTGEEAGSALAAALASARMELLTWSAHAVHHRPRAGVTVGYEVAVRLPGGQQRQEYLCLSSAELTSEALTRPGLVRLDAGDQALWAWRHPLDPELPGLATICDPTAVTRLLGGLSTTSGVPLTPGPQHATWGLDLLVYRPTRRAVVRARAERTAYLKALRPQQAVAVAQRHEMLRAAGVPAPAVLHAGEDGVLVIEELTGHPLSAALARDGAEGMGLADVVDVLDVLPAALLDLPERPAWAARATHYGEAAGAVLPREADRAAALAGEVNALVAGTDAGPLVPVHGDLYEAQIFVGAGTDGALALTGLLDVDAAGPGRRVDDLACLLGHMSVLPLLDPQAYHLVPEVFDRWLAAADELVDPRALRARAAGVVLSLVPGARAEGGAAGPEAGLRQASGRLDLVEHWLAAADGSGDERSLIIDSLSSHVRVRG